MARLIFRPFLLNGMTRLQLLDRVTVNLVDADPLHSAATMRTDLNVAAGFRAAC